MPVNVVDNEEFFLNTHAAHYRRSFEAASPLPGVRPWTGGKTIRKLAIIAPGSKPVKRWLNFSV
jgi:hypothetical protein